MAVTFGAATNDAFTTPSLNWLSANSITFVSLWCYPTTLTAGRTLWGDGGSSATQLEVGTTTSQLILRMKQATTNTVQTLSHPDIQLAVNGWFFVAVYIPTTGGTAPAATSAWIGTESQPPLAMTVTNTIAGTGGYTAATNLAIGQSSNLASAWQGDIDQLFFAASTTGQNGIPFNGLNGFYNADDPNTIYRRWVQPLWRGQPDQMNLAGNNTYRFRWHPLIDANCYYVDWGRNATPVSGGQQVVGAPTLSQRRAPTIAPQGWLYQSLKKPRR